MPLPVDVRRSMWHGVLAFDSVVSMIGDGCQLGLLLWSCARFHQSLVQVTVLPSIVVLGFSVLQSLVNVVSSLFCRIAA